MNEKTRKKREYWRVWATANNLAKKRAEYTKNWRKEHQERFKELKKRNYASGAFYPVQQNLPYFAEDDEAVLKIGQFQGMTDKEVSLRINRSVGSVEVRRRRLKSKLAMLATAQQRVEMVTVTVCEENNQCQ